MNRVKLRSEPFVRGDRVRSTDARWPGFIGRVLEVYDKWGSTHIEIEFEVRGAAPAAGWTALLPASAVRHEPQPEQE